MGTKTLAIPSPSDPIPAGWYRERAIPYFDSVDDVDEVVSDTRRLAALSKYVKDREQRGEVDAARIVAEMRIGELLGPAPGSGHEEKSTGGLLPRQDRVRFRKLAEHRLLVLQMLERGVVSRKRILAKIDAPPPSQITGVELREGAFQETLDDLDDSVAAIITDPPYPREFLPLYSDLSEVAERVLRPGGILAAMVGHAYLPEVMARLGEHLDYRWVMAYLTGGAAASVHARRVQVYWKPIVVFEKPPTNVNHRIGGDVIRAGGNARDDSEHHWGQTESGMAQLIERLTEPGDLVLDPFAGGGTTLVACSALGRPCIGVEVDPIAASGARERLAG